MTFGLVLTKAAQSAEPAPYLPRRESRCGKASLPLLTKPLPLLTKPLPLLTNPRESRCGKASLPLLTKPLPLLTKPLPLLSTPRESRCGKASRVPQPHPYFTCLLVYLFT
jgi:hypothetical protein